MAVLAGGGSHGSWAMVKGAHRWVVIAAHGQWMVVGNHSQWVVGMVGGGCELLVMVVGGGGVVLWSLWPSAFVGCCSLSLWPVVVVFVATCPLCLM